MPARLAGGAFDEQSGIWIWVSPQRTATARPALFLDRDGVIVEDPGYISRAAHLKLVPGAVEVIAASNRRGVPVVEVTNQAGVGRGYYTWDEFVAVEEALTGLLAREGAARDAILACPFHQEAAPPWRHPAHPARKPSPGMLLAAGRLLNLDLQKSWIVGDKLDDLKAGYQAGLAGGLHVLTGRGAGERQAVEEWKPDNFRVLLGSSICDATGLIPL